MAISAERWATDTSVAIAAVDAGHLAHRACADAVRSMRPALAGHAAFEVYSVLTRMPAPLSVDAGAAASVISRTFPDIKWLAPDACQALYVKLATIGVAGGAVYDALVGEAARTNGCRLLTRDLRARRTYDLLGIDYKIIDTAP